MSRKFAKGKRAYSYSERSGLKFPYNEMIFEKGTNLWIHHSESDGRYNEVTHPQNKPPKKIGDNESLKNVFSDGYKQTADYGEGIPTSDWLNQLFPPATTFDTGFTDGFSDGFGV